MNRLLDDRHIDMLQAMGIRLPLGARPVSAPAHAAPPVQVVQVVPNKEVLQTVTASIRNKPVDHINTAQNATLNIASEGVALTQTVAEPDQQAIETADWGQLQTHITGCQRCPMRAQCVQPVVGSSAQGQAVAVQPSPGAWLLLADQSAVGDGQLMTADAHALLGNILRAVAVSAQQVFITPVVKCSSAVAPTPQALAACQPYWQRQIQLLQPAVVVLMGRMAIRSALHSQEPLGKLREQVHTVAGVPAIVTYHPDYLLRNPLDKAKAWVDWHSAAQMAQTTKETL